MTPPHIPSLQQIWEHGLLWNSVGSWAEALIAFLVPFTVLPIIKQFIAARERRWRDAGRQLPLALQLGARLAERTSWLFIWGVALYCAFEQLDFPTDVHIARRIDHTVSVAITLIFWFQVALWVSAAVRFGMQRRRGASSGEDPDLGSSADIVMFVAGVFIWGLAVLLALDNLGIAIRPLLAGLGIGGIAVALAVQTVLGDLLASLSIAMDKPFAIGDALTVDTITGTVEHIGVRSTRLRSSTGEQIIVSNTDIVKSRVRNYGRMHERSVTFELPVFHDTAPEVLAAIPGRVEQVIRSVPKTRFTRCCLLTISESALRFEINYAVLAPDYGTYAETHNAVLMGMIEHLRGLGVQLPTPLQAPNMAPRN